MHLDYIKLADLPVTMATYLLATGARHAFKCVYAYKVAAYYNIPNRASCKAIRSMEVIRPPVEQLSVALGAPWGPTGCLLGAWGPRAPGTPGVAVETPGALGRPGGPRGP